MTEDFLILKSKDVITKILHNYGGFQISTIDTFNQRLIRSFAFDLKLPLNFEVELNTDFLLEQAVESVLAKVGGDSNLTDVLVDFAISKTDQDRSWNIFLDLCRFAQLLVKETAVPYLKFLSGNNLENFISFKKSLENQYRSLEKQIRTEAEGVLASILKGELKRNDFNRRLIPSHFEAIVKKPKDVKFDSKWKQEIESNNPGFIEINIGVYMVLASALLWSCVIIITKFMSKNDSAMTILTFQYTFVTLFTFPLAIIYWNNPSFISLIYTLLAAIVGTVLHLCINNAYKLSDLSIIQPVWFTQLVFASFLIFFTDFLFPKPFIKNSFEVIIYFLYV